MNKTTSIKLCNERIAELKSAVEELKTSDKKSASTQLYNKRKELKSLRLIAELISMLPKDEFKLTDEEAFIQLTTLSTERVHYDAVVVKEGDKLLTVLQAYKERKDIYNKVMSAAEKAGLKLEGDTFVKA